ncbi:GDSL-type esterase/lipase family protein [Cohnella sp. WQ 127256]|uniref:SGNH/GDSL hydrolase family protein n=1 Tax=Cohnella sp. WQ 127256 TaxID=2938790 RepID=UPI002117D4A2|nr:GDSL-type esterase/lipase family protein [Cohnella sp. WQ 127256]
MNEQLEPTQNPHLVKLVQTQHPEKLLSFARNLDDNAIAAIYGMDSITYRAIKDQFVLLARGAAKQLLEDQAFADKVDHLPFKPRETVIGVGESTTDDLLSWFEILRQLIDIRRPQDGIRFINEGISGNTSSQVLGRFSGIIAKEPDWIMCMLGGNDVLRVGPEPTKTLVTADETAQNLAAIRQIAAARSKAEWVWITPPTFVEERVAAFSYFQQAYLSWRNSDILLIGDIIRSLPDRVVDTQERFGAPASSLWVGPDGLHPILAGHQAIVTWLVEELAKDKKL